MTTTTNAAVTTYPTITIDYRRSLDEMVKAGKYGLVNPSITTEHFPIQGEGVVPTELVLIHFDRAIGSDEAIRELDRMGLVPARLEHATAFGEKYPDVQKEFPVVFLGSVWTDANGIRHVPYLGLWDGKRKLHLDYWHGECLRSCRFAAVRKVLPAPAF